MASVNCLYTTVMNISGKEATFSFLPPHGRTMAVNEQLTIAGNLVDRLAIKTSNRQFKAMENAVYNNLLAIVATPSVFVYDDTKVTPSVPPDPMVISGSGGTLGMVDPCWAETGP